MKRFRLFVPFLSLERLAHVPYSVLRFVCSRQVFVNSFHIGIRSACLFLSLLPVRRICFDSNSALVMSWLRYVAVVVALSPNEHFSRHLLQLPFAHSNAATMDKVYYFFKNSLKSLQILLVHFLCCANFLRNSADFSPFILISERKHDTNTYGRADIHDVKLNLNFIAPNPSN